MCVSDHANCCLALHSPALSVILCAASPTTTKQTSYSDDGLFISIGASCASAATGAGVAPPTGIMSTLFAYSKVIL
jgi:hypothetical protein